MKATVTFDIDDAISQEVERVIMATLADFNAKLDAINAAVDSIATELEDLRNKVATGGMNETDEAAVADNLAALQSRIDSLKAVVPTESTNPDEPPPAPELPGDVTPPTEGV